MTAIQSTFKAKLALGLIGLTALAFSLGCQTVMGAINPATSTPIPTDTPNTPVPEPTLEPLPEGAPTEYAVPDEGAFHIEFPETATYEHYPPSSGLHYGRILEWGLYDEEVPPEFWVHNLEHGGIVVLYNCSDDCAEVEVALEELLATAPPEEVFNEVKIVVSPNSQIESPVVALAWGYQLDLQSPDLEVLLDFYARHVNQGPELAP
jgi:hypothetical protein